MIRTKIINTLLSATLLASSIVGSEILATDGYLWSTAPSHAMGLLAFTVISIALTVGIWKLPKYSTHARYALLGVALFAIVQLAVMVGDTISGAPSGVSQSVFSAYLLGNPAFVALIGIQPLIAATALAAVRTALPLDSPSFEFRSRSR